MGPQQFPGRGRPAHAVEGVAQVGHSQREDALRREQVAHWLTKAGCRARARSRCEAIQSYWPWSRMMSVRAGPARRGRLARSGRGPRRARGTSRSGHLCPGGRRSRRESARFGATGFVARSDFQSALAAQSVQDFFYSVHVGIAVGSPAGVLPGHGARRDAALSVNVLLSAVSRWPEGRPALATPAQNAMRPARDAVVGSDPRSRWSDRSRAFPLRPHRVARRRSVAVAGESLGSMESKINPPPAITVTIPLEHNEEDNIARCTGACVMRWTPWAWPGNWCL